MSLARELWHQIPEELKHTCDITGDLFGLLILHKPERTGMQYNLGALSCISHSARGNYAQALSAKPAKIHFRR